MGTMWQEKASEAEGWTAAKNRWLVPTVAPLLLCKQGVYWLERLDFSLVGLLMIKTPALLASFWGSKALENSYLEHFQFERWFPQSLMPSSLNTFIWTCLHLTGWWCSSDDSDFSFVFFLGFKTFTLQLRGLHSPHLKLKILFFSMISFVSVLQTLLVDESVCYPLCFVSALCNVWTPSVLGPSFWAFTVLLDCEFCPFSPDLFALSSTDTCIWPLSAMMPPKTTILFLKVFLLTPPPRIPGGCVTFFSRDIHSLVLGF